MSRAADFERIVLGEALETPPIISNVDKLWNAIINNDSVLPIVPETAIEKYLAHLIDRGTEIPQPKTRLDTILYAICTNGTLENITPISENETLLYQILVNGDLNTSEAEGIILTLLNSTGDNLVSLEIYGNSVQNGTPTPTAPIPIENVGDLVAEGEHAGKYAVEVKSGGKNMVNVNSQPTADTILTPTDILSEPDELRLYVGYAASGYMRNTDARVYNLEIENNTVSWTGTANYYGVGFSARIKSGRYYALSYSSDTPNLRAAFSFYSNGAFTRYVVAQNGQGYAAAEGENTTIVSFAKITQGTASVSNIQLECSNGFTSYEPYIVPITSTLYIDEPLRANDTLDAVNGKLIQNRAVIQSYNGEDVGDDWISSTGALTTGATVEYTLATPVEIDIAGQTIPTFDGTTIITLDTETQPLNMECEYYGE